MGTNYFFSFMVQVSRLSSSYQKLLMIIMLFFKMLIVLAKFFLNVRSKNVIVKVRYRANSLEAVGVRVVAALSASICGGPVIGTPITPGIPSRQPANQPTLDHTPDGWHRLNFDASRNHRGRTKRLIVILLDFFINICGFIQKLSNISIYLLFRRLNTSYS